MDEGGNHPEWRAEGAAGCRQAGELLQTSQYEQVAALLHIAQTKSAQAGDVVLTHLLDAARLLCVSLLACQAEAERHRQACQETERREYALKQELHALLDLLGKGEMPRTLPASKQLPRISASTESAERPSLWRRIRHLWRPRTPPLPTHSEQLTAPMAAEIQSPESTIRPVAAAIPLSATVTPFSPAKSKPAMPEDQLAAAETQSQSERPQPPVIESQPPASAALPSQPPGGTPALEPDTVSPPTAQGEATPCPTLVVYCLGPFRVYQDDQPVEEWPSSKGKSIFKYLVAHRQRPVVKEILMELFWPDMHPDAARNNLNVAIHGLRRALRAGRPAFPHVLYRDDCYLVNPDLCVWVDAEAFEQHCAAAQACEERGDLAEAMRQYRAAEALYQGEYMEEDRYEEWMIPRRQRLEAGYLELLDRLARYSYDREDDTACIALCHKMLAIDPCREEAHRRLMRCYYRQGQPYLAVRQYHLCTEQLADELEVLPAPATRALYEQIRHKKPLAST